MRNREGEDVTGATGEGAADGGPERANQGSCQAHTGVGQLQRHWAGGI